MYFNPYQQSPQTTRPVQVAGQPMYGYGQAYSPYPATYYAEQKTMLPTYPQQRPDTLPVAPAPTAPAASPVPWTDQPIARIFIRPQVYTAAASAEETLRMGTAFPELFRPVNPGGAK
ncbi:MAG: hypothetical protein FWF59_04750 [Turicibacter sp.]|nr:hypothetical protein [Turicibacter sp.]